MSQEWAGIGTGRGSDVSQMIGKAIREYLSVSAGRFGRLCDYRRTYVCIGG